MQARVTNGNFFGEPTFDGISEQERTKKINEERSRWKRSGYEHGKTFIQRKYPLVGFRLPEFPNLKVAPGDKEPYMFTDELLMENLFHNHSSSVPLRFIGMSVCRLVRMPTSIYKSNGERSERLEWRVRGVALDDRTTDSRSDSVYGVDAQFWSRTGGLEGNADIREYNSEFSPREVLQGLREVVTPVNSRSFNTDISIETTASLV